MHNAIDVPFNHRHTCWFCGEPSDEESCFPQDSNDFDQVSHVPLSIPSCFECYQFTRKLKANSVDELRTDVKDKLIFKYQKDLGIGSNWTKKELLESDFECSSLSGFKKSGWNM